MLTNQDVINIFYGAADVLGIPGGWTFIQKAGWHWLADERDAAFDPAHLNEKPPGLTEVEWAHLRSHISEQLGPTDAQGEPPTEVDVVLAEAEDETEDEIQPGVTATTLEAEDDLPPLSPERPVPPPELRKSLLGPAFAVPFNSADTQKAYEAQPAVTKVIHAWEEVLRLAEHIPDAIHVFRHWDQWETVFPYPSTDSMPDLVEKWMNEVEPERRHSEFVQAGGKTLLFEGFNEPDINDPEQLERYTEFESLRIEALAEVGCLACIGQFSVGSPNEDNMRGFLPAIETLNETVVDGQVGALGVHEYGTVWPWAWMGRNQDARLNDDPFPEVTDRERTMPAYLLGRFQHTYHDVFEPAGFGNTPLILTETGLDTVVDPRILEYLSPRTTYPHGYRTCFAIWNRLFDFAKNEREFTPGTLNRQGTDIRDPELFYVELLKWEDDFLRQFPFVKGALPFMSGGYDEWESFLIVGDAMTKFMDYVHSQNEGVRA